MSIAEAYQLAYLVVLRTMTQTQASKSKRTWEENDEMLRPLRRKFAKGEQKENSGAEAKVAASGQGLVNAMDL